MSLRLNMNDGPYPGLGFFLTETGKVSVSRGGEDDRAWLDTYGPGETADTPFDLTSWANFTRTCNALAIPAQAIADAVANKGTVYPLPAPSAQLTLNDADRKAIAALVSTGPTATEITASVIAGLKAAL